MTLDSPILHSSSTRFVTQGCPSTSVRLPCVRNHLKQYRIPPICHNTFSKSQINKQNDPTICATVDLAWLPERIARTTALVVTTITQRTGRTRARSASDDCTLIDHEFHIISQSLAIGMTARGERYLKLRPLLFGAFRCTIIAWRTLCRNHACCCRLTKCWLLHGRMYVPLGGADVRTFG
ncbi:unnamed protein product, partial [Ectocarpus sp. 8 AP-2014]